MRTLALALALLLAPAASRADAAADAAAKSYRIDTDGTTRSVKAGAAGKLVISIVPVAGTHVHPQAPLKITLSATPGLTLSKDRLGHKDAVDPKAEGPRFEVPFVAPAAGAHELTARLQFFVCSDRWCVKQARDVKVAVTAK